MVKKRLKAEYKTCMAEMTSYRLLIDVKASIFSRLTELGEIFVGAFNPNSSVIRAARIRRYRDRNRSPSLITCWRAV